MAVVPGAVAAVDYEAPDTYAKVPFAIVESMFLMATELVPALEAVMGELPLPLDTMLPVIGEWAGGPLSWTVDMLAWGLSLAADIWVPLDNAFDIGFPVIGNVLDIVACGLMECWVVTNCTGTFDPCEYPPYVPV